ncbi:dynein axonemal assembly factor 5-like [Macrosteles quadrilineatus]|uniref:dynein axonemal assembly factor 5-like n=1 Tax=Macrosteles quadrilineatus TaxID=74068 RepID=UPI0023E2228B|nr:dynein axonemal assembly factor 5-like [Macrosteles quadrilineatus]
MTSPNSLDLQLNKYCNELTSEDKKQRKRALENIKKEVLSAGVDVSVSYNNIHKHIIRCFKDNSEAVRESAVLFVTDVVTLLPAKEEYINSIMPMIAERLSGDIVLENSEEVRLCLVLLMQQIVSKYTDNLFEYINDFINILSKTIVDPYPKVKKESCDCAAELAKSTPQYFHMQSESLIIPLTQTLTHQQYRIRVSGIKAIGAVVRWGNNKSLNDVCGPLAERLFDQHHAARAAVADVVGTWLLELPDRYSYFHKLIPLMLTSLSEEITEQRSKAEELWSKVGIQFVQENENDLKDKIDYLQETLAHYPPNVCRPNLGCRTLVQRELSRYLPAVVAELDDWKADVRVKSAQLLCVTVQHAEANITQHLEKTLPALYRACGDADARVVDNIERAAEMLGYFVPTDVYWRLMKPSVQECTGPGPVCVLAAVIRSSPRKAVQPQLVDLANILATDNVCHSRQAMYQKQLMNAVRSILIVSREDVAVIRQQLFTVLVSVLGLAAESHITTQAKELLQELASLCSVELQDLYDKHSAALLEEISASVKDWTPLTPQRFIFEAVLTHAGAAVGDNIEVVLSVLSTCLLPQSDPEATLQMLMAVSYILTDTGTPLARVSDLDTVLHRTCTEVLQPLLVWRAGRSAEALRTAATGCVVAALQLRPCTPQLSEQLVPLLLGLVEDSAFRTRQLATLAVLHVVQALRNSDALAAKDVITIYPVVLKRLDDNNDEVRKTAVCTLCVLFESPLPLDYQSHLEYLYDTMLLHLDDPNPDFQTVMLDAMKKISSLQPSLLKSRIKVDNFRSKSKCEELIRFLNQLHV